MQKLLISTLIIALLGGCSLNPLPTRWVHRQDIQQGNVLEQQDINRLQPGMDKNQVRAIMGTPIIIDVFHQDRWDYIYRMKPGGQKNTEKQSLTLYFVDDRLARLEGTMHPSPSEERTAVVKNEVVVVPPQRRDRGILRRVIDAFSFGRSDQTSTE